MVLADNVREPDFALCFRAPYTFVWIHTLTFIETPKQA